MNNSEREIIKRVLTAMYRECPEIKDIILEIADAEKTDTAENSITDHGDIMDMQFREFLLANDAPKRLVNIAKAMEVKPVNYRGSCVKYLGVGFTVRTFLKEYTLADFYKCRNVGIGSLNSLRDIFRRNGINL